MCPSCGHVLGQSTAIGHVSFVNNDSLESLVLEHFEECSSLCSTAYCRLVKLNSACIENSMSVRTKESSGYSKITLHPE